ncbi:class I SAM-dependent methyltransferase [Labilibaculum sp.]|uniref:class I SAM-dependent methyltransferase n=1 Tax=Labilibaculum sp. TaxID=2060723 RepID=UPI003569F772
MSEMWNKRYAETKYIYGENVNVFFKQQLDQLTPGYLLLPGEGEGRNATYAAKSWKVDAFDYSKQAVENSKAFFSARGVEVNMYEASILDHPLQTAKYDAIGLLFLHLNQEQRAVAHSFMIDALKPGGIILMEVFSKKQITRTTGGPKNADWLYDVNDIRRDFSELDFLHLEEVETNLSEGPLHNGKAMVIRFVGRKRIPKCFD